MNDFNQDIRNTLKNLDKRLSKIENFLKEENLVIEEIKELLSTNNSSKKPKNKNKDRLKFNMKIAGTTDFSIDTADTRFFFMENRRAGPILLRYSTTKVDIFQWKIISSTKDREALKTLLELLSKIMSDIYNASENNDTFYVSYNLDDLTLTISMNVGVGLEFMYVNFVNGVPWLKNDIIQYMLEDGLELVQIHLNNLK